MSAKTILYVEDNELNRKMLRHLLRNTSYRLIEAHDGETGVTMARSEHPDLILMDVQLPKISGIEATRTLRADPATAATPIIAMVLTTGPASIQPSTDGPTMMPAINSSATAGIRTRGKKPSRNGTKNAMAATPSRLTRVRCKRGDSR